MKFVTWICVGDRKKLEFVVVLRILVVLGGYYSAS